MFQLLQTDRITETLAIETTNIEPLITATVDDVRPFLEGRKLDINFRSAAGLGQAEVDPLKISDILTNLIVNAVRFTPDGGTIDIKAESVGTDAIRLAVTDNGIGIEPDALPHLFEPFFTGYDTRRHSSGELEFGKRGIGLGLSLVRRFVELHGGQVEVDSKAGLGSTFSIILPRTHKSRDRSGQGR